MKRYPNLSTKVLAAALVMWCLPPAAQAQVSLVSTTSPTAGQPGVTTISLTGSGFPSGTITASQVQLRLEPATAGAGAIASATAKTIATVVGSTRRVTFTIPDSISVVSPVLYRVSLSGVTTTGVQFASTNTTSLTVNPAASIASISPGTGFVGRSVTALITGNFTSFVQGSTQASFGAGVAVGSGAPGGFGSVTVNSPTSATAQLTIDANADAGARTVSIRTGSQQAAASDAFTVNRPLPPSISAAVAPAPNAAGWHRTNVTVTFTCASGGSPITSCTPPITIASEGANQVVTGAAVDADGGGASATVVLNIDKTGPNVRLTSPANGAVLFSPSTTASGTVTDLLSGLSQVFCNGAPASVSAGTFACAVTIDPAGGNITASATDIAGNTGSSEPISVTVLPAPTVSLSAPANLSFTSISPVTVRGTVDDPNATVTINGIAAPLTAGSFATLVPLTEGINTLTAVATNAAGNSGTASVSVTLDTTPPHVTIDSPAGAGVTTDSTVTVSGAVNDIVVGTINDQDAQVIVNGVAAQVANRTYAAAGVPLAVGQNTIQAIARDRVGNAATVSITITRVSATDPPKPAIGDAVVTHTLSIAAGNNQAATIGTAAAQPLVVLLRDASGNPAPKQPVVFKVTGNSGTLMGPGGAAGAAVAVNTDASGQAGVQWTLGHRSGAGINTVEASSALAIAPVGFNATGLPAVASHIVVDAGDNQIGGTGQPLTFPFSIVVTDAGHNRVPNVPVTFRTVSGGGSFNGQQSIVIPSDSDGRAFAVLTLGPEEGNGHNVAEATFPGNAGATASFVASAKHPGDPAATSISGVVLDNTDTPIAGVTIRLFRTNQGSTNNLPQQIGTPLVTTAQGRFLIENAPVGFFKLMADGSTVTGGPRYPTLEYSLVTVAGRDNTVGMPVYLPALDTANQLCVDETHGGTLTLPTSPGFALTVAAGSATFPGGSRSGCITVTTVNPEKVPMAPGFGQQPRFVVSIQPAGTHFSPPAAVSFPNVDGLPPRDVTEMYSYDHDLSLFVAIGTGTVSDDGSAISSSPGVGVIKAGWHCGGNPNQTGSAATCKACQKCQGNQCVADPAQSGQSCDPLGKIQGFTFNGSDTVQVRIGSSCSGVCANGTCGPNPNGFNLSLLTQTLNLALKEVFDNSGDACIEPGLRQTMQDNLKQQGLIIECSTTPPNPTVCAERPPDFSNALKLYPAAFTNQCGNLGSSLFHELVHGVGGQPGVPDREYHNDSSTVIDCRDRAYGCQESCWPGTTKDGNPFACIVPPAEFAQDLDAFGCNPCGNVNFTQADGTTVTKFVCPPKPCTIVNKTIVCPSPPQ